MTLSSINDESEQTCEFCKKPKVHRKSEKFAIADAWIELDVWMEQLNGDEQYAIGAHLLCVPMQWLMADIVGRLRTLEDDLDDARSILRRIEQG